MKLRSQLTPQNVKDIIISGSSQICIYCGEIKFNWLFAGWDEIYIDSEGSYNRSYNGEYDDSEVTCSNCDMYHNQDALDIADILNKLANDHRLNINIDLHEFVIILQEMAQDSPFEEHMLKRYFITKKQE